MSRAATAVWCSALHSSSSLSRQGDPLGEASDPTEGTGSARPTHGDLLPLARGPAAWASLGSLCVEVLASSRGGESL